MMLGQYCTCKSDDIQHFPILPVLNAQCRNVLAMFEQPSDQCLDSRWGFEKASSFRFFFLPIPLSEKPGA